MAQYDPDKHCGAQRANQPPGTLCTRPKGWGTDHTGIGHCKRHGGSTPSQTVAAQKEIALQAVRKFALTSEDAVEEVDPREALARELVRTHIAVEFLGRLLNDQGDDVYSSIMSFGENGSYETGRAEAHVLWRMWLDERKHLRAVAADAARAGVEAHRMELAEQTARMVAGLLRGIFTDPELGLTVKVQQTALVVAARHLREIGG